MNTRKIVYIAMFAALTAAGAFVKIPVPFTPIVFTLQTLFVVASGLLLGARCGAISQLVYVCLGLFGLPVFTQGGGFGYVLQPSFGYLLAFPIGSFVTGLFASRLKSWKFWKVFWCASVGMIIVYVIGISYQVAVLYLYTGLPKAAALATVPSVAIMFVVDSLINALLSTVMPRIRKRISPFINKSQRVVVAEGIVSSSN